MQRTLAIINFFLKVFQAEREVKNMKRKNEKFKNNKEMKKNDRFVHWQDELPSNKSKKAKLPTELLYQSRAPADTNDGNELKIIRKEFCC